MFVQGLLNAGLGVVFVWFLLHTEEIGGQILFTDSDLGMYTMLGFILALASALGTLALRSASVRYIARYLAEGRRDKAKSVVTRVLQVSAITSLIIVVLLFALAGVFADIFASSQDARIIFTLLPLSCVFQIFYFQTQGFLQGLQKLRELAIISIFYTSVQYSVSIALVYAGLGVLGLVIGWLVALSLSCSIAVFVMFRFIEFSTCTHELKPLLVFSLPIYVSALLAFIVGWVDQIFIFPFLGMAALGVYNLAVRASVVPNLISTAMVASLYPKLSELRSTSGVASLKDAFKTSTRYGALLGFPMSLMVATLAYPLIVLFATVRFADAVVPLAIMCIASIPTILGSAIFPTLYTLERTRIASFITVVSILSEALLSYVALAFLNAGLAGVAFSRLFVALVGLVLGAYVLRFSIEIEFDKEAVWKSAVASIVMVLSLLALELLRATIVSSSYQFLVLRLRQLPIYAVTGLIVYTLSLMALKAVRKQDIELLHDYLPSKLRWIADVFGRLAHLR